MRRRIFTTIAILAWSVVFAPTAWAAIAVDVQPGTVIVTPGQQVQFTVRVTGTPARNRAVTWWVTCGAVTSAGLYTAPTTGPCELIALHASGALDRAVITVTPPPAPEPEPEPEPTPEPTPPPAPPCAEVPAGVDVFAFMQGFAGGTTYCFPAPRLYRITRPLVPKSGDVWTGGGTLSGARLLTGLTFDGTRWSVGGQTAEAQAHGGCLPTHPRCNRAEELFIDDVRQTHVASLTAVAAGTWFFDYAADRVYLGTDPTGKRVELSVTPAATAGTAQLVTIHGVTIEKFASPAQAGAIHGIGTAGWIVRDNVIRLNHGIGLRVGPGMQALRNLIVDNGQLGIGGSGDNIVVEGNEWARNNAARFDFIWEAGGSKFTYTRNLIVRGNYIHHNHGPGLWTDIDNTGVLFEGNRVEDNWQMGILHEISFAAVIRRNVVSRNGHGFTSWAWGAGIVVSSSSNTEVSENTVEGNAGGIVGVQQARGSYLLTNLLVRGNTVRYTQGYSGVVTDVAADTTVFSSRNNRFEGNVYQVTCTAGRFTWQNGPRMWVDWQAFGHDRAGSCAAP